MAYPNRPDSTPRAIALRTMSSDSRETEEREEPGDHLVGLDAGTVGSGAPSLNRSTIFPGATVPNTLRWTVVSTSSSR